MIAAGDAGVHSDRCRWITSSFSSSSGACVEVGFASGSVLVRDSKDRRVGRPVIGLPPAGWAAFVCCLTQAP
jgi:Domain of unknown function (DUF397)